MTKLKSFKNLASLLLVVILNCNVSLAQQSACQQKLLAFEEAAKESDFNTVYASWKELKKNCASDENIFISVEKIMNQHVSQASASEAKNQMIADLIAVYEEHDKAFPNNKRGNGISKSLLLFENKLGSADQIYAFLDQSFKTDKANFTNANVLNIYADAIVAQYNSEQKKLSVEQLVEKLDQIHEKVQSEAENSEQIKTILELKSQTETLSPEEKNSLKIAKTTLQEYGFVVSNINGNLNKIVSCETLTAYYQKGFSANATNALWLERASERLTARKCKSDLYVQISEKWNEVSPTATSAYNLALLAREKRDKEKTIDYFSQAASLQKDATKKAEIYYLIATTYGNSDKAKARDFSKKALDAKPSMGKVYIFLAQLYATSSNDCATNDFDKKAMYWLTANTAKQAGIVEPVLKRSADQMADEFYKKAPSKKEVSTAKRKTGDQITFNCWMNESVSIPKL